jgi:Glycoside hydrolase family 44
MNRDGGVTGPIDDQTLPEFAAPLVPGDPGAADVSLAVSTEGALHRISPLIYGTNGAPEIAKTHQTVVRLGGNRFTAYNWETNASNAGSDWMFQNDSFLSDSDEPARPILDAVQDSHGRGAATVVTVPIVDYVSADKNGGGDVRNSGPDYLTTRFRANHADSTGAFPSTPNTSDGEVYQDEFVAYVKAHAPSDARVLFSLDNEPDLWADTHAEVHPDALTYAELWERNERYSKAIKGAWPGAEVLGFVSYGFNGYVNLQDASDGAGRNFLEWYLDQAKAAEQAEGKRLIDYLDLHWYPEAQGGGTRITDAGSGAALVQARLQAPRSLWDATYEESSWVRDYMGGPIDLLHWLHDKIDAHHPGTKLAFTEWNFGGGGHISGALATADVLGIFGREQVGLATFWGLHADETFTYAAFRAFRNYDGSGAAFGNVHLPATTSDASTVSVYGSCDAADGNRVVILAINKADSARTVALRVSHPTSYASAATYVLQGGSAEVTSAGPLSAAAQNAWHLSLPAMSVMVIVPEP